MKGLAVVALGVVLGQAKPVADPKLNDFRYVRTVSVAAEQGKAVATVCAVLDGAMYAHTSSLNDVRLYSKGALVPYALSTSGTALVGNETAEVLNEGTRAGHVVFDLRMPARAYSTVFVNLRGMNYLATAKVTGLKDVNETGGTDLGSFTLFDLSVQHLGASGAVHLQEVSFPFLHVDLAIAAVAGGSALNVGLINVEVPPSREDQTLYTVVAETTAMVQRGRQTVATIELPARVPVERVSFVMEGGDRTNFNRDVSISAVVDGAKEPRAEETIGGAIGRVKLTEGGKDIRQETLSVPATLGANAQRNARVEIKVENGDDKPLALRAVRLEMRERKLCFDGPYSGAWPLQLAYGNAAVGAAVFDYGRVFEPGQAARLGVLGAEGMNAGFVEVVEVKPLLERHPEILWVALLGVVGVLGWVAFRSGKRV